MSLTWIHCNYCLVRHQSNINFFLTECGHLKCEKCASRMNDKGNGLVCLVCKTPCQVIQLTPNLKPDIQYFFKPLSEILDKAKQVYMFQDYNIKNLIKSYSFKYDHAKKEIIRSHKVIDELKRENQNLKTSLQMKTSNISNSTLFPGISTPASFTCSPIQKIGSSYNRHPDSNIQKLPGYPQRLPTASYENDSARVSSMNSPMACDEMNSSKLLLNSRNHRLLTPIHSRLQTSVDSLKQSTLSSLPIRRILSNKRHGRY